MSSLSREKRLKVYNPGPELDVRHAGMKFYAQNSFDKKYLQVMVCQGLVLVS